VSHLRTPVRGIQSIAFGLLATTSISLVSAAYDPNYFGNGLEGNGVFAPHGILMHDHAFATSVVLGNGSVHSPGTRGTIGKQIFGGAPSPGSISYEPDSAFAWDFHITENHVQTYDKVVFTGEVSGTDAHFLAGFDSDIDFGATFWDLSRSWDNIFVKADGTKADLSQTFKGDLVSRAPIDRGSFSFKGNALVWSPVPEPSSALAGLLLCAGILRRRRGV